MSSQNSTLLSKLKYQPYHHQDSSGAIFYGWILPWLNVRISFAIMYLKFAISIFVLWSALQSQSTFYLYAKKKVQVVMEINARLICSKEANN